MTALPLKADMGSAVADVRYGPKADIRAITRGQPLREGPQYRPLDVPQHAVVKQLAAAHEDVAYRYRV
jgi:hypothetical protein